MKCGVYFAYWTKEWLIDYKKHMDKVSTLGFDVLETSYAVLRDVYTTKEQLIELREYAKEKGPVLTAGYGPTKAEDPYPEDPEAVRWTMTFFKDLFSKLQLMSTHILGRGLYSYWPIDFTISNDKQGGRVRAVRDLRGLSKTAEECDAVLGVEVPSRYEGYIFNTCEEATDLVDGIEGSHVKITLGIFHMNIEETSMADAIRKAGDRLGHLYLGERNHLTPGKGSLPWAGIRQALRGVNYQGTVVIEPLVMQGGTIGSEIEIWRDMVPDLSEETLDRDAKGVLEFYRHVFGI